VAADDMTPGEIRRSLDRLEQSQRDAQRAVDDRLTKLAADMMPTTLWASEHKALSDDVKHLEADFHEAVDRVERTSQERMATLRNEIKTVRVAQDNHAKSHEADHSWSRSKTLTVIAVTIGAAATLIAAYIATFAAAGGVR
jgi:hypothetical protein